MKKEQIKNLDDFVFVTFNPKNDYCMRPQIHCVDGFSMSVQGSKSHYCQPRETINAYYSMEIGYPSTDEPLIAEFAEDKECLTGTVYGYVPVDIIQSVIEKHGGIDIDKTFENTTY